MEEIRLEISASPVCTVSLSALLSDGGLPCTPVKTCLKCWGLPWELFWKSRGLSWTLFLSSRNYLKSDFFRVWIGTMGLLMKFWSHWTTLQEKISHWDQNTLQHTATLCNTLQHPATPCDTLQLTASHCSILQHTEQHCRRKISVWNTTLWQS